MEIKIKFNSETEYKSWENRNHKIRHSVITEKEQTIVIFQRPCGMKSIDLISQQMQRIRDKILVKALVEDGYLDGKNHNHKLCDLVNHIGLVYINNIEKLLGYPLDRFTLVNVEDYRIENTLIMNTSIINHVVGVDDHNPCCIVYNDEKSYKIDLTTFETQNEMDELLDETFGDGNYKFKDLENIPETLLGFSDPITEYMQFQENKGDHIIDECYVTRNMTCFVSDDSRSYQLDLESFDYSEDLYDFCDILFGHENYKFDRFDNMPASIEYMNDAIFEWNRLNTKQQNIVEEYWDDVNDQEENINAIVNEAFIWEGSLDDYARNVFSECYPDLPEKVIDYIDFDAFRDDIAEDQSLWETSHYVFREI